MEARLPRSPGEAQDLERCFNPPNSSPQHPLLPVALSANHENVSSPLSQAISRGRLDIFGTALQAACSPSPGTRFTAAVPSHPSFLLHPLSLSTIYGTSQEMLPTHNTFQPEKLPVMASGSVNDLEQRFFNRCTTRICKTCST